MRAAPTIMIMEPAQPPSRPSRRRRLLPGILAALLVADVAGAVGTAVYHSRVAESRGGAAEGRSHARAVPGAAMSPPSPGGTEQRVAGRGGKQIGRAHV